MAPLLLLPLLLLWAPCPAALKTAQRQPPEGLEERLLQYCAAPMGQGAEHQPPAPGLELRGLVLAFRHGDRSAIGRLPGVPFPQFSCETQVPPARLRVVSTEGTALPTALSPPAAACEPGQLTAAGQGQMRRLGGRLREAYGPFLAEIEQGNGSLYVRSTKYPRTIGSAAALVMALLPEREVQIVVDQQEGRERMHGVGLRRDAGICPRAYVALELQNRAMRSSAEEVRELRRVYGDAAANKSVSDFTDVMLASQCHGRELPCGQQCPEPTLISRLMQFSDDWYGRRYAGAAGGKVATELSTYPLMEELLQRLQRAAEGPKALSLFSGHDTTIAPLLSALGLFEGARRRWPPYAARVALELYSNKSSRGGLLVRALYNGEAMATVRGCHGRELCPLADFAAGVRSLLGGKASWKAACAL